MEANSHLQKLLSEKQAFLNDLRPKYITPSLLKYKVLTQKEEELVLLPKKSTDQVETLIEIMKTKNDWAFTYFIFALHTDEEDNSTYPWLAKLIETSNGLSNNAHNILVSGIVPFPVNNLIPRLAKLKVIQQHLTEIPYETRRKWIVLFGPIGSGKTVLAAEAVRDNNIVHKCFPGGVYWMHIGSLKQGDLIDSQEKEKSFKEAVRFKIRKLLKLMDYKTELSSNESLSDLVLTLKKEVSQKNAADQKMLLILDDVWSAEVIKAFDIGCPILVTTKHKGSVEKISSYCDYVECRDDLELKDVQLLLSKFGKCSPDQLPDIVKKICVMCKGSPLMTSLIGGMVPKIGNDEKSWEDLHNRLVKRGPDAIRRRYNSGKSEEDLSMIVNLCLKPINHLKEYYLDFLIFINDTPVPVEFLVILWDKERYEVLEIMDQLLDSFFVEMEQSVDSPGSYSYYGHDIYLDTLKAECDSTELKNRHKNLVQRVLQLIKSTDGKVDLTKLPQGYIPYTIGYHLYQAGAHEELEMLYLDLKFLEQKISMTDDVIDLKMDFSLYKQCFKNKNDPELFASFLTRNTAALKQKKYDIIQLALFEPPDSVVYKNAMEYALKAKGPKYYNWCNKDENISHLYNYNVKYTSDGHQLSHASFNHSGTLVAWAKEKTALISSSDTSDSLQELHGHSESINYCAFNARGDRLATASSDTTVKIYKIGESLTSSGSFSMKRHSLTNFTLEKKHDNSMLTFSDHDHAVVCCSYSPGDFIISSDITGVTFVWEVATEMDSRSTWSIKHKKRHHHREFEFSFCCFSDDGTMFGTAVYDTIKLWDFYSADLLQTFTHDGYLIKKFTFVDGDAYILSISDNNILKWNVEDEKDKKVISTGHNNTFVICSICISPDGNYIACGTTSASVIIISLHSEAIVDCLRGHIDDVINVMFSNDGGKLLSVSSSRHVIHDVAYLKDATLVSFERNLSVREKDNILVATSNYFNHIEVREGIDGKQIASSTPEEDSISACSLSRDCLSVVYGTKCGKMKVFDFASNGTVELFPNHSKRVNYILHSIRDSAFFSCSEDKTIGIWREGCETLILKGHTQSVLMCTEFKKSSKLLSCSKDGSLRIWDTISGELILPKIEGHGNQDVTFCDISPLEGIVASASTDETIKVWDAQNGSLKETFQLPNQCDGNMSPRVCRFSPVNMTLISGHDNGKVVRWHLEGKQKCFILPHTHDSIVYNILFSSDGSFLTISHDIKIWSRKADLLQTIRLPSSSMGLDPPCIWASDNFGILVVISNSILYILKRLG